MRIALDLTALTAASTGVDTYINDLVSHLARIDTTNRYVLFLNFEDRHRFDHVLGRNMSAQALCVRPWPGRLLFQQCALPLAATSVDVIHSPSFLMPMWRGRARHLLTVHDMTFFSMPATHSRLHRSALYRRAVALSIRRAHLVNVPSSATRQELLRCIPDFPEERVRVTPWGVNSRFCPSPRVDVDRHVRRLGVPIPYILYV